MATTYQKRQKVAGPGFLDPLRKLVSGKKWFGYAKVTQPPREDRPVRATPVAPRSPKSTSNPA